MWDEYVGAGAGCWCWVLVLVLVVLLLICAYCSEVMACEMQRGLLESSLLWYYLYEIIPRRTMGSLLVLVR
jgi:hypothetical protein